MLKYYPKNDNMCRDGLTNDILMDKDTFLANFIKMFPEGRIFINYLQLRKTLHEFFKHWNLM